MYKRAIYSFGLLIGILIVTGITYAREPLLKVAFLDIGQGDAIYIEAPNGNQMIIDGGPASNLSEVLPEVMPFGDKSINVIMVTNPDTDHYSGFWDILDSYEIGAVIESGTITKTKTYAKFEEKIVEQNIPDIIARKGMAITLDKNLGIVFTVLFPDRDVSKFTTNDGSIEGILSYGDTKVMFTGDGTKKTESYILSGNKREILKSDILKVAHHGSATSSSEQFVKAVLPKWSVISVGSGNSYGLPKQITLDILKKYNTEILRTDKQGTIIFLSDGVTYSKDN